MSSVAGYFRDMPGQDYAMARYYSATSGSFWSPDPGSIHTADVNTPTSWNRYGYVQGDPVNNRDRTGLYVDLDGADVTDYGGDSSCSNIYLKSWDPSSPSPCDAGAPDDTPPQRAAPPPLTCDFGGMVYPSAAGFGSGTNIGYGDRVPVDLIFNASGGSGSYQWSDMQTYNVAGSVSAATGITYPVSDSGTEKLSQDPNYTYGGSVGFFDAPGIPLFQKIGRVTSASEVLNFTLNVWVSSNGQMVHCPTVYWQAQIAFHGLTQEQRNASSSASASVILVIP